jgi:hypothetical protein
VRCAGDSVSVARSVLKLQNSKFFLSGEPIVGAVIKRHKDAGVPKWHHGFQLVSIAVGNRSAAAARRDSSDDGPSSQSNQRGFRIGGRSAVGRGESQSLAKLRSP